MLNEVIPCQSKKEKFNELLEGYFKQDIWRNHDAYFDKFYPQKRNNEKRKIDFSYLPIKVKDEFKFVYATKLLNYELRPRSLFAYSTPIILFGKFLCAYYPNINSIIDVSYNKVLLQWNEFLINNGIEFNSNTKKIIYTGAFKHTFSFFYDFYDTRTEFEKDVWDVRNIPGSRYTPNDSHYFLKFNKIPIEFRIFVKRYFKYRIITVSLNQCTLDLLSLRLFFNYIYSKEPTWTDLKLLNRTHIEDYLAWAKNYKSNHMTAYKEYIINLNTFFNYIQCAQYVEAPNLAANCLILRSDFPKRPIKTENTIKYIPETVLKQLDDVLEYLTPNEYIPIVILLRASGWRISDILNLRYNNCLDKTNQGWYLCGDILKTNTLNHRIPITDEVAVVVKSVIEDTKSRSTIQNNPNKLLFVRFQGKRVGQCPQGYLIRHTLNKLANKYQIMDDNGNIFHFKNHAFRHTKGVELINNGMNILHVQKWLAHASAEMTLNYAKVLDETLRKSWEEATRNGLFRIDETGSLRKIDISDIEDEDIIEWEYIRHNLDAVRMPLGYCMKPKKLECHTQLNPCLSCRNLCTTPDFIPQYEQEIKETKSVIEYGKNNNRNVWVEKNQALLDRYESILSFLKKGNIHHKAGKKGREYIGEERIGK